MINFLPGSVIRGHIKQTAIEAGNPGLSKNMRSFSPRIQNSTTDI